MATKYTLKVKHDGTETGDFCLYQTCDNQTEDIRSLVWFSKRAHNDTLLKFDWNIDYGFAWSEQGTLTPGVVFEAHQNLETDPTDLTRNTIGFTKKDSAFKFNKVDEKTTNGRMSIVCDESIPAKTASIGISMSGQSAFACTASPNMKYTFRPHPRYWIAFGKFEEGEVIDLNRMTRKFEIRFDENQYERTIYLSANNTWVDGDTK